MKKGIVFPKGRGVPYVIDVPADFDWKWMAEKINCSWIEIVRPRRLPEGFVMIVDEEGLLKPNEANFAGCWFYETDKHGEPIVGDALILKEEMGDDGIDCVGMDEDDVNKVFDLIRKGK